MEALITEEGLKELGFTISYEVGARYCRFKHFMIISHGGEFDLQTPIGKQRLKYIHEVEQLIKFTT